MPRVKIDYIVSFSSEDPDNPASNLLAWDVSKKRWLCAKGEPSCSVVLQLPRAVKISAVHIGAHHAALVEVLVGRSEKPNEPFQVLVPSCVFLSPAESRKDAGVERVRSFSGSQLAAARAQRWDRVRLVCSQPYNKHCKYGLSFVHISEPEDASAPAPAPVPSTVAGPSPVPGAALARLLDAGSSSDDEFKPGELFARHNSSRNSTDTGAQIRQATSQALKNISDSATKLVKTPLSKHGSKRTNQPDDSCSSNRQRDDLMYTDDDDKPHAKIDNIVQRHKDEKSKDEVKKTTEKKHDRKASNENPGRDKKEDSHKPTSDRSKDKNERTPKDDRKNRTDPVSQVSKEEPSTSSSRDNSEKDRKRSRDDNHPKKAGGDFQSILKGVVFVLSGYVNPRRAALRDIGLSLGARCERDWGPNCTHLICAFPNTPKLKQVRAAPGGGTVPAARGEWLEEQARRSRRLPWRAFATEPQHQRPLSEDEEADEPADDECDTDDEIVKALRKQKKRRTESSPSPPKSKNSQNESSKRDKNVSNTSRNSDANGSNTSQNNVSNSSDVMFVRDERIQGNVTVNDSDDEKTDEDDGEASAVRIDKARSLPNIFAGRTFVIDASARDTFDAALLERYVRAYGGVLVDAETLDEDSSVSYVLCGAGVDAGAGGAAGARVRGDWLWRCHAARDLYPVQDYLLT
ncbi:DNA repair protein XRCC1 [Ostrinia nubilalis]|uniref:DNA repair protein XRCC1 n=1 Tax=Ostrinia nubilalis TaxID=29057 RepID=UPI00308237C5